MHDKTILITGAGSFAKAFTEHLLKNYQVKKIIILSRDEWLQHELEATVADPRKRLRFFIGDVKDLDSWRIRGVDYVVHTAAMKRVDKIEYNPIEAVKTNIMGTINLINICQQVDVKAAVFLSTDKAVMPVNLYGATKMTAEKCWLDANYYKPIFSVTRYGNVMGSRGSVLPYWKGLIDSGEKTLPITDLRMTRFWTTMGEAIQAVIFALNSKCGYIWVPKSPCFKLQDLARALYLRAELKEIGIRPGEKLHETLIHEYEYQRTVGDRDYYLITPEREYIERGPEPGATLTAPITSEVAALKKVDADDPRRDTGILNYNDIRERLK